MSSGNSYLHGVSANETRTGGGVKWIPVKAGSGGALRVLSAFTPSSYSANKSATTTVTGQSEAIASGASALRVRNLDATNFGYVAFGTSAANAETNVATGVAIEAGAVEVLGIPANATHYAWLGDTGTVSLNIIQGS